MENKIERAITRYSMDEIYNGVIVGFSGGADSSAILHYLSKRTKNLLAVHINHMIRGEEALRDELFCKTVCAKYGVKILTFRVDVPRLAKQSKQGVEETARKERYKIFAKLLSEYPEYKCVVTAHNANDNAETIIFNLTRGSGTNGIAGIKPNLGNVYRPLIYCTKDEILEYCKKNSVKHVNDSTNDDIDYTRNYIRHEIVPMLEKLNPSFLDSCMRMSENVRDDESYIKQACDNIILENKITKRASTELINSLHKAIALRVLKHMAQDNLDSKSVDSCIQLAKNGSVGQYINLPNGISFKKERGYVRFVKTEDLFKVSYNVTLKDGLNNIKKIGTVIAVNTEETPKGYELIDSLVLKTSGDLIARNRKDGDKITQGKMTKKLKKLFYDRGIPSHERDKIPVICDELGVVCVPSVVVRDGAKHKCGNTLVKVYKLISDNA